MVSSCEGHLYPDYLATFEGGLSMLQRFFIAILFLLAVASVEAHEKRMEIRIGIIAPLTGGLAERGVDIQRTIELMTPYLNRRSEKYKFRFIIDDGKCGIGNSSTTIANKFIHVDRVTFLLTACSGETLQVGPIAELNKVVNFAVLSMHQDVKTLGDYIFRTYVDVERGIKLFPEFYEKKGIKKVALITEENAFTEGIKGLLEQHLGDRIISSEYFAPDSGDLRSIILRAKAKKPDAYYLNAAAAKTFSTLVKQLKQLGISSPLYTYHMPEDPSVVKALGEQLEGIVYMYEPAIKNASPRYQEFLTRYKERYSDGPSMEFLVRSTYDAVMSIADSVETVGPNTRSVKAYLYKYESQGALGKVSYDENGDIKGIDYVLKQIRRGTPTLLTVKG